MPRLDRTVTRVLRRSAVAAAATLLAMCGETANAADVFPYVAYVTQDETYVRSGPGGDFYPTGQLNAGYAVEVYRHDGDGWCAIRPVEGSFSLAPAHQLRVLDSRTAEVIAPGVPARIGSSLSGDRKAVQVYLERREMVQLLEPAQPNQPFLKIAPPAGEFRFVAASRLALTPPTEGAATAGGKWQSTGVAAATPAQYNEPALAREEGPFAHLNAALGNGASTPAPIPANPAWHPHATAASAPPAAADQLASSPDAIAVVPGSPAASQLASPPPAVPGLLSSDSPIASTGQPRIRFEGISAPTGPFDSRVMEMQLRLSQIVVQPPATWQLGGLREEAASLLAQGETPQLRDQLRDLLDRIATFESVQARYRTAGATLATANSAATAAPAASRTAAGAAPVAPAAGMTGQTAEVLSRVRSDLGVDPSITPTPGAAPPVGDLAATDAKYDAVGTLKPVVSKRAQAPRFALVDDHGDVVTFVTASPDVNLQSYVGQRIGVLGNRGFMPEYRRAHVTASRVTPLEERLVR
ncbi:hypothetical protein I41_21180 [Lacipirellula limnantheis]|uniref:SH3b domain-containing protein n=1 Tax=Lacipirellula limnantheis TaxID=2528024 RepID=A0A517TX40_9BACT|nr:hypothetical protein I41_21180 [Lacipirellula limnantheis]